MPLQHQTRLAFTVMSNCNAGIISVLLHKQDHLQSLLSNRSSLRSHWCNHCKSCCQHHTPTIIIVAASVVVNVGLRGIIAGWDPCTSALKQHLYCFMSGHPFEWVSDAVYVPAGVLEQSLTNNVAQESLQETTQSFVSSSSEVLKLIHQFRVRHIYAGQLISQVRPFPHTSESPYSGNIGWRAIESPKRACITGDDGASA